MTAATVMLAACCVSLVGAVVVIPVCRNRLLAGQVNLAASVLAGLLAAGAGLSVLAGGPGEPLTLLTMPEYGSALRIHVDGLSAVFLLLIALISALAALYSLEYMEHYAEYSLLRYYPYFQLFVAGMYAIVVITDLMAGFFICWQLMTLASYALVRFEYRKVENIRAANRYLVAMQVACALILAGAAMLAQGPATVGGHKRMRFDFDAISHGMPDLLRHSGGLVTVALLCFLLGFGIKAGMWPFGQCWLPAAHPAAPSPISALLSGVMIKTGMYGLMRSFLWLVREDALAAFPSQAWRLAIAGLGTITLFVGTMQALRQEQSKRLLAFHSIGQMGYILLGLGACLALLPAGVRDEGVLGLAALAFYGSLFHAMNHGIFKSLLFLNAGSMLSAIGTQDLNRLGGLMRPMPTTAVTALIASLSISGVPLFNGFASKWSLYVAAILGSAHAPYLALCVVVAILTSTLTLASFLKFFGASFLSRRSAAVAERIASRGRLEVGRSMQAAQVTLAVGCLLFGLAPLFGYWVIQRALATSPQGLAILLARPPLIAATGLTGIAPPGGRALFVPLVVLVVFGATLLFAAAVSRLGGVHRRAAEPWLCGYALESEQNRYTAHNFYREVTRYFHWLGGTGPSPHRENGAGRSADAVAAGAGTNTADPRT
ncbi:MAG: peroxiredoxin family protein [candidate division NC10 bacterium]|nr:peroxiredoxin family protein [candidate division NC10 bacterium]